MFSVVEMRNCGCVTVLLSVSFNTDAYFSLFHLLYLVPAQCRDEVQQMKTIMTVFWSNLARALSTFARGRYQVGP